MPVLKRPAELHWNFRQPNDDIFPKCPGANTAFLGPSGTGKTTTIVSLLLGPYKGVFDRISVWSPSVEIDSAWNPVREYAKNLEGSSFHSEWGEGALRELLDDQRRRIQELKQAKSKKPLYQTLLLIDDHADSPVLHQPHGVLATAFVRGRHMGLSCWVSTQKLTALGPVVRTNVRAILVWRLRNAKEIQSLLEELSAIYPVKVLQEMYEEAVSEPYSFWYINLVAKRKEDMFYERFEHKLVVDQ